MEVLILNFGYPLSEKCKEQVQIQFSDYEVKEVMLSASFDIKKCLYPQVVTFLDNLDVSLDGRVPYLINISNLSIVSTFLITELYARSGAFPQVLELVRDESLGIFILKRIVNLEYERRMTRNKKRKYKIGNIRNESAKEGNC